MNNLQNATTTNFNNISRNSYLLTQKRNSINNLSLLSVLTVNGSGNIISTGFVGDFQEIQNIYINLQIIKLYAQVVLDQLLVVTFVVQIWIISLI